MLEVTGLGRAAVFPGSPGGCLGADVVGEEAAGVEVGKWEPSHLWR